MHRESLNSPISNDAVPKLVQFQNQSKLQEILDNEQFSSFHKNGANMIKQIQSLFKCSSYLPQNPQYLGIPCSYLMAKITKKILYYIGIYYMMQQLWAFEPSLCSQAVIRQSRANCTQTSCSQYSEILLQTPKYILSTKT